MTWLSPAEEELWRQMPCPELPEITFREKSFLPPVCSIPLPPFGIATVPAGFVPILLSPTPFRKPESRIPGPVLPEIRFPPNGSYPQDAPLDRAPMQLLVVLMSTPAPAFGTAAVPEAFVPMKFPCTLLYSAGQYNCTPHGLSSSMRTPAA